MTRVRWMLLAIPLLAGCPGHVAEDDSDAGPDSSTRSHIADGGREATVDSSTVEAGTLCPKPPPPYFGGGGDVINPGTLLKGLAPGSSSPSTILMTDFYDCDGSKGVNALAIEVWPTCGESCLTVFEQAMTESWAALNVKVVVILLDNNLSAVEDWAKKNGSLDFYACANPDGSMVAAVKAGLPARILVDPRTLKVVSVVTGVNDPGDDPDVATLAQKNAH